MKIEFKKEYFTPEFYPELFANKFISDENFKALKKGNIFDVYSFEINKDDFKNIPVIYYVDNNCKGVKERIVYYDNKHCLLYFLCFREIKNGNIVINCIDNSDIKLDNIKDIYTDKQEAFRESLSEKIIKEESNISLLKDNIKDLEYESQIKIKEEISKLQEKLENEYLNKKLNIESAIVSAEQRIKKLKTTLESYK